MAHWQPKENIERVGDDNTPVQLVVGRKSAKQVAIHQEDKPDVTQSPITRAADYVAQGEPAAPAAPPVMVAPPIVAAAPVAPQVTHQHQQPQGQTMSNDHTPCHQHPAQAHPAQNWYGGQPMQYAAQPLVVQQLPAPMHSVQTNQAPDVTYRKGVLGIGSEAFDLTGEMMDSFEFKAKFIMFLQSVLATDLNVQAALFTPNEKKQDAEIAALAVADSTLKHALQCAYYENGDIVFPGIKNECGKDARVKVPPVDGISYDMATDTLMIGSAKLVIPVKAIAAKTINAALNAAAMSLPKVKKSEDITDLPVFDRDDECAPAKSATLAQLSEAIVAEGIPQACEAGKLKEVVEPTGLLAFGAKKCREFGFVSLADFLKALNKTLPLAPKGVYPSELRGFAKAGVPESEARYPVKLTPLTVTVGGGTIVASGQAAGAGIESSKYSLAAPAAGWYIVTGSVNGYVLVDTDAAAPGGTVNRNIVLSVGASPVAVQGDSSAYTVSKQRMLHSGIITFPAYLAAGETVSISTGYSESGMTNTEGMNATIRMVPLSSVALEMNPA